MLKTNYLKKNYILSPLFTVVFIGVLLLFYGCNNAVNQNITTFGGKIKNPQEKYVYIIKNKKVIDSAKLNEQSRFSFKLDSIKTGLYTFKHGPEFQYLYLEPQDSLLIYLNTWDFDESLIFSGKGSAKNNYLINLYLEQEKNEKNFKYNYRLKEKEFSKIIEKGIQEKLIAYNKFIESEGEVPSAFFEKLAKAGIYYPYYYIKEYYPFNHKYYLKLKDFPEISTGFYDYRKNIDLNDESLLDYTPYTVFIQTHLYHLAYVEKGLDPEKSNIEQNYMNLVNDKIHIESFKNELLASSMWKSLSNEYLSVLEFSNIEDCFYKNCSDEKMIAEIKKSIFQKKQLQKGDSLPMLMVTNLEGKNVHLNEMAKNNTTVIYFWPKNSGASELLNEKLTKLQKTYPHVLFLGVERNKNKKDWENFIHTKNLSKSNQFNLPQSSEKYAWFEGDMARTIIVDDKGQIQNPYLFFNDMYFEKYLKKFKK